MLHACSPGVCVSPPIGRQTTWALKYRGIPPPSTQRGSDQQTAAHAFLHCEHGASETSQDSLEMFALKRISGSKIKRFEYCVWEVTSRNGVRDRYFVFYVLYARIQLFRFDVCTDGIDFRNPVYTDAYRSRVSWQTDGRFDSFIQRNVSGKTVEIGTGVTSSCVLWTYYTKRITDERCAAVFYLYFFRFYYFDIAFCARKPAI